ncbi:prephenate dehydrogenase [Melissospora conviva]|uniref:prephenate dehydrogenase n=1 Tax=Melissospora conviva TaxID=3388432 RepID=UPI003C1CD902
MTSPVRVAVVGTGLIGGSVLLRLRAVDAEVTAWDPDPAIRAEGRRRGLNFADDLAAAVRDRDVVFLAGPLPTLPATLAEVATVTGAQCVLTDVGSTKSAVAAQARAQGLQARFVPGHPMAGAERAGLMAADPDLFTGAAWALCPEPAAIGPFRFLTALLGEVFAARVVPMTPATHDRVVALSSHVPHLLAGGLAGAVAASPMREAVLSLAAGSFRDGSRVAATPAKRTADMLLGNRDSVLEQLAEVSAVLDDLAAAVRAGDAAALIDRYQAAREVRGDLTGRTYDEVELSFPAHAAEAELAALVTLAEQGGHLTGCRRDAAVVVYSGRRPSIDRHG